MVKLMDLIEDWPIAHAKLVNLILMDLHLDLQKDGTLMYAC